jgi:hypothetical protein
MRHEPYTGISVPDSNTMLVSEKTEQLRVYVRAGAFVALGHAQDLQVGWFGWRVNEQSYALCCSWCGPVYEGSHTYQCCSMCHVPGASYERIVVPGLIMPAEPAFMP